MVCGGIGAYKIAGVVSGLSQEGMEVHCAMTASAQEFITPLTLATLSGHKVHTQTFEFDEKTTPTHITLGRETDLVLVAPATANTLAKAAGGQADDLVSSVLSAVRAPVLILPSMNTRMFANPANQRNLKTLKKRGFLVMEPGAGPLACAEVGRGRLPEPERIIEAVHHVLGRGRPLLGRRIVVTAGATRESLDPVRFISNRSSGAQGAALAAEALRRGAKVDLVLGAHEVAPPPGARVTSFESAADLSKKLRKTAAGADCLIMAAAVADYAPQNPSKVKNPKSLGKMEVQLRKTPDVLAEIAASKARPAVVVGFSAETQRLLPKAREKLLKKKADLFVANMVAVRGLGFGSGARAKGFLVPKKGKARAFNSISKEKLADLVLDEVQKLLKLTQRRRDPETR